MSNKFGKVGKAARGFPCIRFDDAYGKKCSLQCSSAIDDTDRGLENPGTSFVWLGVNDACPKILASKAEQYGVVTDETTGWVDYPVPGDVIMTTRMHLSRVQVKGLIDRLQEWLDTGHFSDGSVAHLDKSSF